MLWIQCSNQTWGHISSSSGHCSVLAIVALQESCLPKDGLRPWSWDRPWCKKNKDQSNSPFCQTKLPTNYISKFTQRNKKTSSVHVNLCYFHNFHVTFSQTKHKLEQQRHPTKDGRPNQQASIHGFCHSTTVVALTRQIVQGLFSKGAAKVAVGERYCSQAFFGLYIISIWKIKKWSEIWICLKP